MAHLGEKYGLNVLVTAAVVLSLLAGGCAERALPSAPGKPAAAGATQVDVVQVTRQDIQRRVDLPGASVLGYQSVELMARIDGYVKEVHVDIGTRVKQGDMLAVLDVPEMVHDVAQQETLIRQAEADLRWRAAEVEQARAQLEADRALNNLRDAEYRRISNMVESGALWQQRLDEARFALEAAVAALAKSQADIASAEAHVQSARARIDVAKAASQKSKTMLQYATIRAPFDGVITRRLVDRGAFVRPATSGPGVKPLFSIVQVDQLRVVVSVPMTESTRLVTGQKAVFKNIGGLPGETAEGKISRYAAALEPDSRMMRAEIDLSNQADSQTGRRRLKPGMFGTVSLVVESLPGALTVPASAVGSDAGDHYVMVVENGRCRRQEVTVLFNDAVTAAVVGVGEGASVVAKDVTRLKDGQAVTPRR